MQFIKILKLIFEYKSIWSNFCKYCANHSNSNTLNVHRTLIRLLFIEYSFNFIIRQKLLGAIPKLLSVAFIYFTTNKHPFFWNCLFVMKYLHKIIVVSWRLKISSDVNIMSFTTISTNNNPVINTYNNLIVLNYTIFRHFIFNIVYCKKL